MKKEGHCPDEMSTDGAKSAKTTQARRYQPQDKERVLEIIERVWNTAIKEDHAFLWDWKHVLDATARNDCHVAQVVERNGRVVGYCGAIPVQYKVGGKIVEGAACMDIFTDPESRGSGVRLIKHLLNGVEILIGAAVPRSKELWHKLKNGDRIIVREVRKMVYLLDPTPLLRQKGLPEFLLPLFKKLWSVYDRFRFSRTAISRASLKRLERIDRFPIAVDALALEFSERFLCIAMRDHRSLNWRFSSCPFQYEKRLLWDGDRLVGYIVYRICKMNGRKVMLLVEILAIDRQDENYEIMLSHLEQVSQVLQVSDIQTIDPGCDALRHQLKRRGYFMKKEKIPVIGHIRRDLGLESDFYHDRNWYLSLGDADFEFVLFKQGITTIV